METQLSTPYRRESWVVLLRGILGDGVEIFVQPQDVPLTNESERKLATGFRQFGRAKLSDGKVIGLFEIDAAPRVELVTNRVGLRSLVSRRIDQANIHAVLAFFVQPGEPVYRLTFAARESSFNLDDLSIQTQETAARRFTYVLGPGELVRTAALRLNALSAKRDAATVADVTDAFSVEKLNKEFFGLYKEHYLAFCRYLIDESDAAKRVFKIDVEGLEDKARDRALKPVRDFVKKLLGRLVFLHFLQRKGWLGCAANRTDWSGGPLDFIRQLFDSTPARHKDRFHSTRLVPLFFDTLNNPNRERCLFAVTGTRIPYLNGGLFERDFPGVQQLDFPAPLFDALLEFFGQYHFTIDENDPEDHEIGIDPEMLGHIFENLLEDNKDKGAYYTPKAVVQYMCQQSLIHALAGHFRDDPDARGEIEALIRSKEPIDARDSQSWLARHATALTERLDELRICDPAIGSGAFPIGLLQEIYWTKLALNPSLDRARAKREIIQRSIHGVDLDAGAVEIARLRFWLALIVEESFPVPLPNLDYQIMQGNSLLESFEGERLDDLAEPMRNVGRQRLGSDHIELDLGTGVGPVEFTLPTLHTPAQHRLAELRRDYFACHEPEEKARLRAQIDAAVLGAIDDRLDFRKHELSTALEDWHRDLKRKQRLKKDYKPTAREEKHRAAMQAELAGLDSKKAKLHALLEDPRAERPFFLWHLWFRHVLAAPPEGRGGFDIVIANPPYVRQEAIKDLKPALKAEGYECFDGIADLLVYFYECAVKKLRPGGVLAFITSNKFYRAGYGEALRAFLARELTLHRLIDFGDAPVFEAIAYASILEGGKAAPAQDSSAVVYTWEKGMPLDHVERVVTQRGQPIRQSELTPDGWRLESSAVLRLLAKLRANGAPLGEYVGGRFYRGILTGLNEAFVVDRATHDRLIAEHKSSAEILKPFLRGRDVKRWRIEFAEQYLIKIESSENKDHPWSGKSENEAEKVFAATYPAVHARFEEFRSALKKRDDQGKYFWELRSCAYWNEFDKLGVIYPELALVPQYAYSQQGWICDCTLYVIPTPAMYLTALMNSAVVRFFFQQIAPKMRGDYLRFKALYMSQIPIPTTTPAEQATLSALVDRILAAKRAGDEATVVELEAEIDTHVFRLYGLTPDEITIVKAR